MKLVRYGEAGLEQPGLLGPHDVIFDLSRVVEDIHPRMLADAALARIAGVDLADLKPVEGQPRLGPPVAGIGKIVCIGLNYSDHAQEVGSALPKEPQIFLKATSAISGPHDPIARPRRSQKLDYEVELGVVIGSEARYVDEANALDHVAGFILVNDVSEREYQMEHGGGTTKGKSADSFAPLGPWLVTRDEIPDSGNLRVWTKVNGETRQDGSTTNLVFKVPALIAYLTRFMSLRPGDIISTGTPAGVGHGHKPPRYLNPGDVVEMGIEGLGTQKHTVAQAE